MAGSTLDRAGSRLALRWPPLDWPRPRRRRWLALIALVTLVTLAHLLTVDGLVESRLGWGEGEKMPPRIEVAFVRELAPAAPPPPPPRPAAPRRAVRPAVPASAPERKASAPEPQAAAPEPVPEPIPPLPAPAAAALAEAPESGASEAALAASTASAPVAAASEPAATSTAAAAVPGFDWPPSTRLRYRLSGNYRGPLDGSAQVDWLRSGTRYQVHLETSLGPMLSRHITSEGELTDRGLAPQRFDGEQKVLFRDTRRWTQRFTPTRITLADGTEVDAPPGAQDEASQFVQLTWLFTTHPELLQVGRSLVVPLALNRRVDNWIYDVVGEEMLYLPFGAINAFHVKPRREAGGADLTAEIWIAPTLEYLPVRILLRKDAQTYVDLKLDSPPLQAAPEPAPRPQGVPEPAPTPQSPPTGPRGEAP